MRISNIAFRRFAVVLVFALSGCATTQIPKEQLQNFALVVPQDLYGNGAAVTEVYNGSQRTTLQMSVEGGNVLPGVSTRPGVNVLPGRHRVQVTTCRNGGGSNCTPYTYEFEAYAGKVYVLRGPDQRINVLDRFNKTLQGYLNPVVGNKYITDQELIFKRNRELAAGVNAGLAAAEQRELDQAFIRKIGARVCKEYGSNVIYSGYVEGIADDKVKIHIADAYFKDSSGLRPKGFSPSTIWESPLQWELCK
ncbi:hypothetical protein ACWYXO_17920 [Janthinobacterium aestuarii]